MPTLFDVILFPIFWPYKLLHLAIIWLINVFRTRKTCQSIDDDLLLIPANILVQRICEKQVSARKVIEAYIKRQQQVNPQLNAIVETRYEHALKEADDLDAMIANTSMTPLQLQEKYPLLGIPVTVKESIPVNGMSNTSGCYNAKGKRAEFDAEIVERCKRAGGIILCVTNTPELCMNWETYNNLTGLTRNPYDLRKTSGGSSGGEGALLGSGASLIGLGSDIAGSLRLPAHYCGVYSFKPTPGSIDIEGHYPTSSDTVDWPQFFTLGGMVRYASDLELVWKCLIKDEVREVIDINKEINIGDVKVCYASNLNNILTNKTDMRIQNSIKKIAEHFNSAQQLDDQLFDDVIRRSYITMLRVDGIEDPFYDKPRRSYFLEFFKTATLFWQNNRILFTSISLYVTNRIIKKLVSERGFNALKSRNEQCRDEIERILGDNGVLIVPTFHRTAPYHMSFLAYLFDFVGTAMFNALSMPVVQCHVGFDGDGMPYGVQIVAKRNCDRVALAVAKEIERAFGGWKFSGEEPPTKR